MITGAVKNETVATRKVPVLGLLPMAFQQKKLLLLSTLMGLLYYLIVLAASGMNAWLVGLAGSGANSASLWPVIYLLAAAVVAAAALIWVWMAFIHDYAYAILADLRKVMFENMVRISPRFVLGRRSGDINSVVMGDVEVSERFFAHTIADYAIAIVMTVATTIALAFIHPLLSPVFLVVAVLVATVPFWLAGSAERQGKITRSTLGNLSADVVDGVQGMRELTAFGAIGRYLMRLEHESNKAAKSQLAYGRRVGLEAAVSDFLMSAGFLTVLALSAWLVGSGAMAGSYFPVAVVLVAVALAPIASVTQIARELGDVNACAARMLAVIEHPSSVTFRNTAPEGHNKKLGVTFDKVGFAYDPSRGKVLDDVSFDVKPGETVALVGPSGVGKTSCLNLLLRLWDVDSGAIRIGGRDIRALSEDELRSLVAVVPQDIYLFNTSVLENIRLARPEATRKQVEQAAKVAQIHDFIANELPDGYDTISGERGVELSGGQRQRIAIARAVLMDAPVLIMDESSSNLDSLSEKAIATAMKQAARGRTTILVAHRPSTIKSADREIRLGQKRAR